MEVIKTSGHTEEYSNEKLVRVIKKAYRTAKLAYSKDSADKIIAGLDVYDGIKCSDIRKQLEKLFTLVDPKLYNAYTKDKFSKDSNKEFVSNKQRFIESYKKATNTANSTVDANSNVSCKNIGVLSIEAHKEDNIKVSRGLIMEKLRELYPDFNAKNYVKDLENHIIYKHDESAFLGPTAPYCVSATMYPFLLNGLKGLGGFSGAPTNLDSFCGSYTNYIFLLSSQFAGAVATSEFLMYFTYFAKKEYGNDFFLHPDRVVTQNTSRCQTILDKLHQYWQGVINTINQPMGARGLQSAFVNFSYFDKPFFENMFEDFAFPDGTKPDWDSLFWVQKEFMQWFNAERLKTIHTFPVETYTLLFRDGEFVDQESYEFVCEEFARGHSFFVYISDTVDSLSSCCRLKNKIQAKGFNYTNGNISILTGSKSVITLNLSRITQDWARKESKKTDSFKFDATYYPSLKKYIGKILDRVYKYHDCYNEWLWDMYDNGLLPVYTAGFIDLNKQYMTIGLNGLNQAAEFLGMDCTDNEEYAAFCQNIFSYISEQNREHDTKDGRKHKLTFNCEMVPAESLAVKNYNWDKEDGYWVPSDTNLYASYVYKPNDKRLSILDKLRMHGRNYIGEYLDGGSAAHINLDSHASVAQYRQLVRYAAEVGCSYFTWNIPNSECVDCGFIAKTPFDVCPKCGSHHVYLWDRIIGYLTKIANWPEGRFAEQKLRVYTSVKDCPEEEIRKALAKEEHGKEDGNA